jgi:hypothetical protein
MGFWKGSCDFRFEIGIAAQQFQVSGLWQAEL